MVRLTGSPGPDRFPQSSEMSNELHEYAKLMKTLPLLLGSLLIFVFAYPHALAESDLESGKRAYAQGDFVTALQSLAPLAQQGNAEAEVILGIMNLRGQGVGKDAERALKWFTSAAAQENAEAQFYVGSMYFMGAGVRHDSVRGLKLLELAADQGNADAQVFLGLIYFQGGGGVARDFVQSDVWFHLAADRGDPLAPQQVVRIERQMTPADVAKAKALAAAWKQRVRQPSDLAKSD